MPALDLPLDKLREYRGRNPRPPGFDAFWDRNLASLDQLDPQVELKEAVFQVPGVRCFDLRFTGTGGARVYAKYLRPATTRPRSHPAMLEFHGYTMDSGAWSSKLALVAQGFCVAALDCRGQGGQSEDRLDVSGTTLFGHIIRGLSDGPEHLLYKHIFLDTALLARIVMGFGEVDPDRVAAAGGSQGGALTLACAALTPRLARCAPIYPFLCDYQRVWEMDLAKDAYVGLKDWFRRFDPLHTREAEVFTTLGHIDCQFLAERIKCSTLFFTGLADPICPPSTQFAAYNRITAKKNMILYPDYGHEHLPLHQDLLLQWALELGGVSAEPAQALSARPQR